MKDIKNGILLKGIGGFYYVETADATYECKARGVFRKQSVTPFVGDKVSIETNEDGTGVITDIFPRKNEFNRPPLSNIDQLIFVVSTCDPAPNFLVLDKLIAIAEYKGIEPVIAITKTDLKCDDKIETIYKNAGFNAFITPMNIPEAANHIKSILTNKISAFIGNSGVGKSSLLNNIDSRLGLKTSDISHKLGRGRHTTRHVELFKLDCGGYVADTPGFSSIDLERYAIILKQDLQYCFREFEPYIDHCKFTSCSHTSEKSCAVCKAVTEHKIETTRHESYVNMYNTAKNIKEWEVQQKLK
ncbi:MAG: rsgA [Oscillospiraceae bacterium]|jgi:ribosome biogenesis GTPase|nr:rsgA [Oscillospiraceae bacterium]